MPTTAVNQVDTFDQWRLKTNTISTDLGAVSDLTTVATTAVTAINELKGSTVTFSGSKTFSSSVNLTAGNSIIIDSATVLSKTALGSGVITSSLTSVGTLATGVWQGTVVNSTYGGTGINNGGRTITLNTGNLTLAAIAGGSSVTVPSTGTLATLAGTETLTGKTIDLATNTITGTLTQFNTALANDDFAALAATQTLTNKTIALGSNSITGTLTQFNAALTGDDFAALAEPQTLTNKTVSLTSNTLTGTLAEFNTALTDANFATLIGTETLTNKTLTDSTTYFQDESDNTRKFQFQVSGVSTAQTRILSIPDSNGTLALRADTHFIGSTEVALNRSSSNLALTGILSVTLPGSSSGTVQLIPAAAAGTTVITLPSTTGTIITTGDTSTVTNTMLAGSIANVKLANSAVTVGSTSISLGSTVTALSGLASVTSTAFVGALTGNATTATTLQTSRTINGTPFNGSADITITAAITNTLTVGSGVVLDSGASFNGSAAKTISVDTSVVALKADTHYIGTTAVTLNRASGNLGLTGISSAAFPGSTSGAVTIQAPAIAGTTTITLPSVTGTIATLAGTETLTNKTLGNITVGIATGQTISTNAGELVIDSAAGTTNVNDKLKVSVVVTAPAAATPALEVFNGGVTKFSVNSSGDVVIVGTLNVTGNTTFTSATYSPAWSIVTGKKNWNGFTDGTNIAYPEADDSLLANAFKFSGTNGVTTVIANNPDNNTPAVDRLLISLSAVPNSSLANSTVTIGSTSISLGSTATTLVGLASVTSTAFVGALTGNASSATTAATATNVAYSGLTGTVPTWNQNTTGNAATATTATNVAYSGLTGIVPTWNQNTTGNAATATNVAYSGLTGTVPTWNQSTTGNANTATLAATATNVAYSGLTGTVPTWNQNTTGIAATATNVAYSGLTGTVPTWNQSTTGNANTATLATSVINGVYTTDTGTVTNAMLAGSIANAKLANSAISINGTSVPLGGTITLANTGVTSLSAGSGIGLSAATGAVTITNTDLGSAQNIFKNIAVAGQNTIAAEINNDTLTIAAGTVDSIAGLGISTDSITDTITISHADTSAQASVTNTLGNVIQSVSLDTYGHATSLTSVNLDSRYVKPNDSVTLADVTVGNLIVSGTTTTVNSTTVEIADLNIVLGKNALNASAANGGGITLNGAGATINYASGTDRWVFNKTIEGTLSGNATTATTATNVAYSGLTGTVPTWNQNTTGNAATVTNGVYVSAVQTLYNKLLVAPQFSGSGLYILGSLSGQAQLVAAASGSSVVLTLPAATGTIIATGTNGLVTNAMLANSSVTIGSTAVPLGTSVTTIAGLSSVTTSTLTTTAGATIQGVNVGSGGSAIATNTALGAYTLWANSIGDNNTATGIYALYSNTAGTQNTANGAQALYNNKIGDNNTANGFYALLYNTTGYQNTASGASTLLSNTTGTQNTANGYYALTGNTTGYQNTASGVNALYDVRPTSNAISAFADYSGTVAGTVKATSVGHGLTGTTTKEITGTVNYQGAKSVTVIDANNFYFTATWASTQTGWWSIGSEGNTNTALGYNTGRGIITGSGNTILGAKVGSLAGALTNNIILANGTGAIKAQHDGTNWTLTGNNVTATGNITATTSLGVGTAASGVAGEIRATGNITAYYTSDRSLKENIVPIAKALEKIDAITGVNFDWTEEYINDHGGEDDFFMRKNTVGVIAQEIETVLPEAVAMREDGLKAVRYELIIPLLIQAIKELKAEVQSLKAQK